MSKNNLEAVKREIDTTPDAIFDEDQRAALGGFFETYSGEPKKVETYRIGQRFAYDGKTWLLAVGGRNRHGGDGTAHLINIDSGYHLCRSAMVTDFDAITVGEFYSICDGLPENYTRVKP